MKKLSLITVFIILVILIFNTTIANSIEIPDNVSSNELTEENDDNSMKRFIVSYYPGKKISSSLEKGLMSEVEVINNFSSNVEIIEFSTEENLQQKIDIIKSDPAVRLIEEDKKRYIMDIPNDEFYSQQWSLTSIESYEAWQVVGTLEHSVKIAVIDSGIEATHPDLCNRIAVGGKGFLNGNISNSIDDTIGHGTGVSGVIAAQTGNSVGIAGVSGTLDVSILPLKVFWNLDECYSSDLINALDYAISQDVDVINMSLGSTEFSQLEMEAVQRALDAGIVVVSSSGNNGNLSTAGQYIYPASYDGVISVGAITSDNVRAYYSNYNDKVSLVAPGTSIKTTYLNSTYKSYSGTSFSAPIVSSIAAVIKGENPTITVPQIKSRLESTSFDLGEVGKDNYYGYGRVSFYNSIKSDQILDGSNGIVDSLILDRNSVKIIVPLEGVDGYAYAYSTQNSLYQYLKGDGDYPIVYGIISGTKYMEIGGINGYAMNQSLYETASDAMLATSSINVDIVKTFYIFNGFDSQNDAILISLQD